MGSARPGLVAPIGLLLSLTLTACQSSSGGHTTGNGQASTAGVAACAAPQTVAKPTTVAAGYVVHVRATDMVDGCRDTNLAASPAPAKAQKIVWRQDSRQSVLDTVDADATGLIDADVTIPEDASPGEATITIGFAESARITVTAR